MLSPYYINCLPINTASISLLFIPAATHSYTYMENQLIYKIDSTLVRRWAVLQSAIFRISYQLPGILFMCLSAPTLSYHTQGSHYYRPCATFFKNFYFLVIVFDYFIIFFDWYVIISLDCKVRENNGVKYILADNMRQGKKKFSLCSHKVMHRKRVTCELHDSYFRSMTITHAIPKIAEVTHPNGQ